MNQRWSVQNHIKTVHAIAVCNLVEMSMGLIAEASIPKHLRWLPMGMDVTYTKKALGRLTAESSIDPEAFFKLDKYPGQVKAAFQSYSLQSTAQLPNRLSCPSYPRFISLCMWSLGGSARGSQGLQWRRRHYCNGQNKH